MNFRFSVVMKGLLGLVLVPFFVNANVLEEVVVTAQKREQNLSDVGISITAFTGKQVKELGFTNTIDVVSMTPGFNYTVPNAEGRRQFIWFDWVVLVLASLLGCLFYNIVNQLLVNKDVLKGLRSHHG